MNPKKQIEVIAEAHGWKHGWKMKMTFSGEYRISGYHLNGYFCQYLPDYLSNLNDIHEALNVLTQAQRVAYSNHLARICGNQFEKIFANAAQCSEAFLKAVGKWEDE